MKKVKTVKKMREAEKNLKALEDSGIVARPPREARLIPKRNTMHYSEVNIKELSNSELWQLVLTPVEERTPEGVKQFLSDAESEFHNRKAKLQPICK